MVNISERKSSHFIESWIQRVVGANIEAAGQVVHRHGTHACHKDSSETVDRGILDCIEELAEITLAMCLFQVSALMSLVGKNLIGEVVVLIDEEIDFLTYLIALVIEVVQLGDGILLHIQSLLGAFWQEAGIDIDKVVELDVAIRVHTFLVVVKSSDDDGEVEAQGQVGVALRSRVLTDIEVAEERLKVVLPIDVVVMLQHVHVERLAEAARTDVEEFPLLE